MSRTEVESTRHWCRRRREVVWARNRACDESWIVIGARILKIRTAGSRERHRSRAWWWKSTRSHGRGHEVELDAKSVGFEDVCRLRVRDELIQAALVYFAVLGSLLYRMPSDAVAHRLEHSESEVSSLGAILHRVKDGGLGRRAAWLPVEQVRKPAPELAHHRGSLWSIGRGWARNGEAMRGVILEW